MNKNLIKIQLLFLLSFNSLFNSDTPYVIHKFNKTELNQADLKDHKNAQKKLQELCKEYENYIIGVIRNFRYIYGDDDQYNDIIYNSICEMIFNWPKKINLSILMQERFKWIIKRWLKQDSLKIINGTYKINS